jgi:predicted SnoaL-like aldol condensation-catalyzing enzyme
MPTPEQIKALVERFNTKVFNEHDLDAGAEMLSEDFVEHSPFIPGTPPTKEGALQDFRMMFAVVPDMRGETIRTVVSGNKVAVHTRSTGTDSGTGFGAMMGVPATGKPFTADSMDVLTVGDDLTFTDHYGIFDVSAVMMQLGLLPPPPTG